MVLKIVAQLDAKLVQGRLASHVTLGVPLFIFLDKEFFALLTVFIVLLFQLIFAFLLFHHGADLQLTTVCVLVYNKSTQYLFARAALRKLAVNARIYTATC